MKELAWLLFFCTPTVLAQTWQAMETTLTGNNQSFEGQSHSWADIDGDGDYDLYTDLSRIWLNNVNANGTFINGISLLPGINGSQWSAAFGDFNNDGKPDLHIAKGGSTPNSLLENRYPAAFVDVAADYGYDDREFCQPAYWADYDRDGLLDLYITHEIPGEPHEFWKNNYPDDFSPKFPTSTGPDTFGLADLNSHAYGLTWGDIDIDGDIDAVTSACGSGNVIPNQDPHNKVYENRTINPKGPSEDRFLDRTLSIGVVTQSEVINGSDDYWATLFDYDNDGFPDLFIGDNDGNHRLWHNTGQNSGDFGFELVPGATHGLEGGGAFGHTAVAGDYDNDGDLDLYITVSGVFRNNGNGTFTHQNHVPTVGSFTDASWVDYNRDGWLDLFHHDDLYRNPGGSNRWLAVELVGEPSQGTTKSAHGVKIRVTTDALVQTREHRFMVATYSQQMLPTHFGLGTDATVNEVRVFWPNGSETVITDVASNQLITIVQQADCSGTLTAVSPTAQSYCNPESINLEVASSNSASVVWSVKSGPSIDQNQFSDSNELSTVFTPSIPGSYELTVQYIGCPESTVTFTLTDTDFNEDGDYSHADLQLTLPEWRDENAPRGDLDANGIYNLLDIVRFCHF